jgi:hypothetical protein
MKPYRFHLVLRGGDSNISPKGCGSNKAVSTDIFLGLRKSSVKKKQKKNTKLWHFEEKQINQNNCGIFRQLHNNMLFSFAWK